ncbi:MAG: FAD-binding protein [Deltaproteobacteria bacterium]|nr:MAG: FAD-binding protein [Deltaproteobacteria bacterium]
MIPDRADVAIVGAGTAGAAAAALCARRGLRVVCVDRRPLDAAGARWVNGVPAAAFDAAGIARPTGAECRGTGAPFHLVAGWGPQRLVLRDHGVWEVDMRLLVARLQDAAREAGAVLAGGVRATAAGGGALHTDRGTVRAAAIVDASGLAGARLLGQPAVRRTDLCAAAQAVFAVDDRAAAEDFFARHGVSPGDTLCFTGIHGGFSILNVRLAGGDLSVLTGSIPALGHPSGEHILRAFAAEHAWIGARRFGGARAIPLRRPYDRLAADGVAALGDAACQVFPAHASGIGAGLVAARMLADALADGRGVDTYAVRWQRTHGGLLAAYDVFRRLSQALTADELARLIEKGIMDPDLAAAGLAQRAPVPSPASLPGKLVGLLTEPVLAARMADALARMVAVRALYAAYPRRPADRPAWSRRVARVFGDRPDPV